MGLCLGERGISGWCLRIEGTARSLKLASPMSSESPRGGPNCWKFFPGAKHQKNLQKPAKIPILGICLDFLEHTQNKPKKNTLNLFFFSTSSRSAEGNLIPAVARPVTFFFQPRKSHSSGPPPPRWSSSKDLTFKPTSATTVAHSPPVYVALSATFGEQYAFCAGLLLPALSLFPSHFSPCVL